MDLITILNLIYYSFNYHLMNEFKNKNKYKEKEKIILKKSMHIFIYLL